MNAREARLLAMEWVASNADYLAETFTGEVDGLAERDVTKVQRQVEILGRRLSRRAARAREARPAKETTE